MGASEWVSTSVPYLAAPPGAQGDVWAGEAAAEGRRGSPGRGGAVRLLADLGHVGVRVREDVTARPATDHEREQLGLAAGEPVLRLTRLTPDDADRPIQVDIMAMPPRRQKLRYEIRIGRLRPDPKRRDRIGGAPALLMRARRPADPQG